MLPAATATHSEEAGQWNRGQGMKKKKGKNVVLANPHPGTKDMGKASSLVLRVEEILQKNLSPSFCRLQLLPLLLSISDFFHLVRSFLPLFNLNVERMLATDCLNPRRERGVTNGPRIGSTFVAERDKQQGRVVTQQGFFFSFPFFFWGKKQRNNSAKK